MRTIQNKVFYYYYYYYYYSFALVFLFYSNQTKPIKLLSKIFGIYISFIEYSLHVKHHTVRFH